MSLSAGSSSASRQSTANTNTEEHLTYGARNDPVSRGPGFRALAWHAAAMRCHRGRHPEGFVLVALFVFLFLGGWRSTLIPTLRVPVSLIGTFLFMLLFGPSISLITLFAPVPAIGVVVDDAIVMVEAAHAKMHEKHLSSDRATLEVVREISGAIIAITLMMTSVFVPLTFMTGPVGTFYRRFGLTMATSIVLSGVVALTLTPVLRAMILKPHTGQVKKRGPLALPLHLFDRGVEKVTGGYAEVLRRIVTRRAPAVFVINGLRHRHRPVRQS